MWNSIAVWFSNRENTTFFIAVCSFLLSVLNFAETRMKNRKSLSVKIHNTFSLGPTQDATYCEILNISFENKSREAIVLSRMQITCGPCTRMYGEFREKLLEHSRKKGNKEISRSIWFSDTFPLKIEGLGCAHCLIYASGKAPCIADGKTCYIKLSTNKGIIRKKFTASLSNLELLSKCRAPSSEVQATR